MKVKTWGVLSEVQQDTRTQSQGTGKCEYGDKDKGLERLRASRFERQDERVGESRKSQRESR